MEGYILDSSFGLIQYVSFHDPMVIVCHIRVLYGFVIMALSYHKIPYTGKTGPKQENLYLNSSKYQQVSG